VFRRCAAAWASLSRALKSRSATAVRAIRLINSHRGPRDPDVVCESAHWLTPEMVRDIVMQSGLRHLSLRPHRRRGTCGAEQQLYAALADASTLPRLNSLAIFQPWGHGAMPETEVLQSAVLEIMAARAPTLTALDLAATEFLTDMNNEVLHSFPVLSSLSIPSSEYLRLWLSQLPGAGAAAGAAMPALKFLRLHRVSFVGRFPLSWTTSLILGLPALETLTLSFDDLHDPMWSTVDEVRREFRAPCDPMVDGTTLQPTTRDLVQPCPPSDEPAKDVRDLAVDVIPSYSACDGLFCGGDGNNFALARTTADIATFRATADAEEKLKLFVAHLITAFFNGQRRCHVCTILSGDLLQPRHKSDLAIFSQLPASAGAPKTAT
jgi:hypothetical protein